MLLSKCAICDSKKLKFIKEQEAKGLLSGLGIRTHLSKILLVGPLLLLLLTLFRNVGGGGGAKSKKVSPTSFSL